MPYTTKPTGFLFIAHLIITVNYLMTLDPSHKFIFKKTQVLVADGSISTCHRKNPYLPEWFPEDFGRLVVCFFFLAKKKGEAWDPKIHWKILVRMEVPVGVGSDRING